MQALRRTIETLVKQLRGFSPTARLLIGALMVILAMGLMLVAAFAGKSQMVPLGLAAGVDLDARTRTVSYLDSRRIDWEERGGQLYVPVDDRLSTLAQLAENQVIGSDEIDFSAILEDDSPFMDRRTRAARYLVVKMNAVARMVGELSGIERASVVIDQPDRSGGLGAARIEPTAAVTVLTKADRLTQTQADAIARLVAGAHAELKVGNVTVVDARSGRAVNARDDGDLPVTRYLETKLAHERVARTKIEKAMSVYPGVIVAVNAQVNATEEVSQSTSYTDPKVGIAREATREMTSTSRLSAQEPGVRPNTGVNLAAGGRTTNTSDARGDSDMVNAFGNVATQVKDPKGYAVQINATVLVPESYVAVMHRDRTGDQDAIPDEPTRLALAQELKAEIKRLVEPLIDTGAVAGAVPGTVVVSLFADVGGGGNAMLGGDGVVNSIVGNGLAKTAGLTVLALVSLSLMFMMVRRASREEELPSAEELVGIPPALAETDSGILGEAHESVAAMEGIEIDEGAVRRQQMVDQINDLASTAPDEAASLLRKWIKTDD